MWTLTLSQIRLAEWPIVGDEIRQSARSAKGNDVTLLFELFDMDSEVVAYSSLDECLSRFRFYRANPPARRPFVEKARKRVLAQHTYVCRLQAIAALVHSHFGG